MDTETNEIEEVLKTMRPSALSEPLLDRFAKAMDGAADPVERVGEKVVQVPFENELAELEKSLQSLVPHGMPENMIGRLDDAMARWHEKVPLEEKVVAMTPGTDGQQESSRPGWRSVAAVALLGAGAALLGSGHSASEPVVASRKVPISPAAGEPVVFTPGDARSSVVSANDHGVFWADDGLPVRCFEVEMKNEVFFTNDRGEKLTISQPKRELMFAPVKLD